MTYIKILILTFLALYSCLVKAQDSNVMMTLITQASQWLETLSDKENIGINIQVIQIDDPSYNSFLKQRMAQEDQEHFGEAGLSALYERYGQKNGLSRPTCFILFNTKTASILKEQFFNYQNLESMAMFLVAHEFSHCLEHHLKSHPSTALSKNDQSIWRESLADAFGGMISTITYKDLYLMNHILQSRKNHAKGTGHDTAKNLNCSWNDSRLGKEFIYINIKETWKRVDKVNRECVLSNLR